MRSHRFTIITELVASDTEREFASGKFLARRRAWGHARARSANSCRQSSANSGFSGALSRRHLPRRDFLDALPTLVSRRNNQGAQVFDIAHQMEAAGQATLALLPSRGKR